MKTKDGLISVIVPVYQVEAYLPACVDSILNQSYSNWELILVDDGSRDNSGSLCDAYAARDRRIRVYHQENRGVSAARNMGLELAGGEYIAFVDSDDLIKPDYLEVLYRNLAEHGADIACCCAAASDGEIVVNDILPLVRRERMVRDTEEVYGDIVDNQEIYWSCIWGKLIRADLAKRHRFSSLRYGEDGVYMCELFCENCVVHLSLYEGYYYVDRSTSAMATARGRNLRRLHDEMEMDYRRLLMMPAVCDEIRSGIAERCAQRIHSYSYSQVVLGAWARDALREEILQFVMQEKGRLSSATRRNMTLLQKTPWLYRTLVAWKARKEMNGTYHG